MKFTSIKKCLIAIAILLLVDISITGYISLWREWYWAAVSEHDLPKFIIYMIYFAIAALFSCFISGYSSYLISYTALCIRRKLTQKAFKLDYTKVIAGEQRVQEDCLLYPQLMIQLITGIIRNTLTGIIFASIIWYQMGWWFLLFPFAYALIGTYIAHIIAKPLIHLNYINQNYEARFRQILTKLNYAVVHRNNYNLFTTTKRLSYFQNFYNQITVIIPYVVLAGSYFSLQITFGILMQVAASIAEVINSLSFFLNAFNDINKLISCRKRLQEIEVI